MLKVWANADIEHGYNPGEDDIDGYDITIGVTCSSCNRLVYRKEVRQ
jgi:hypothetical protein